VKDLDLLLAEVEVALVEASVAVDETWSEVIVQARKYTDSASFWPMLFQTFAFG